VALVLGLLLCVATSGARVRRILRDRFAMGLLVLTLIGAALIWQGLTEVRELNFTRWHSLVPLLFYCFFLGVGDDERTRRFLFKALAVCSLLVVGLCMLATITSGWSVWYYYLDNPIEIDRFMEMSVQQQAADRAIGIFANQVFSSTFCMAAAFVGVALFSLCQNKWEKILGFLLMTMALAFVIWSQTRFPAILILAVTAIASSLLFPLFRSIPRWFNLFLCVLMSPVALWLVVKIFLERDEGLGTGRTDVWLASLSVTAGSIHNFFLGVGVNGFYEITGEFWHSHNHYLFTALVCGVPFAILYYLLLFWQFRRTYRAVRDMRRGIRDGMPVSNSDLIITYATFLVFVAFLIEAFVETTFLNTSRVNVVLYALMGLTMAQAASPATSYVEALDQRALEPDGPLVIQPSYQEAAPR
jgi:hypothetical protein